MRRLFMSTWEALALRLHPLVRVDSNTIHQKNGLNNQVFSIFRSDNGSGTVQKLTINTNNGSSSIEILSDASGASATNLYFGVAGTANRVILTTGNWMPSTDRGHNLGGSGNQWNQVFGFQFLVDGSGDISFAAGAKAKLSSAVDGYIDIKNSGGGLVAREGPAAFTTLTDGATVTIATNGANHTNSKVTLGGNRTLAITGAVSGSRGKLIVIQDATGSRTLTLPASSKVANGGGGSITLTTTANAIDILEWYYDGTNYYWTFALNFT